MHFKIFQCNLYAHLNVIHNAFLLQSTKHFNAIHNVFQCNPQYISMWSAIQSTVHLNAMHFVFECNALYLDNLICPHQKMYALNGLMQCAETQCYNRNLHWNPDICILNKLASLAATLFRNSAHWLTGVRCRATSVAKKVFKSQLTVHWV